jgi:hypothetical protein
MMGDLEDDIHHLARILTEQELHLRVANIALDRLLEAIHL